VLSLDPHGSREDEDEDEEHAGDRLPEGELRTHRPSSCASSPTSNHPYRPPAKPFDAHSPIGIDRDPRDVSTKCDHGYVPLIAFRNSGFRNSGFRQ
jgi:hypothetical protein